MIPCTTSLVIFTILFVSGSGTEVEEWRNDSDKNEQGSVASTYTTNLTSPKPEVAQVMPVPPNFMYNRRFRLFCVVQLDLR